MADDAATRSSEDRFVCENEGDGAMLEWDSPNTVILEGGVRSFGCRSSFSESMADGISKPSS